MADRIIWKARKRNLLFFGLPWTFTVYSLDEDTFNITKGFLNMTYEEIKLYKIRDFTINRNLLQRIFGLGTIHICSADSSTPEFDVMNVKDVMEVKKIIAAQVENAREASGVTTSEFYVTDRPGQH
ncbi:MAG: PH domain-containing protein [Clostridia bacterium]|nr:PH domain-containing protein [Clostridia bacterium]